MVYYVIISLPSIIRSYCVITLALKTEWTRPLFIDFFFSGMIPCTIQTKDSHWFLCSESPTNNSLFPWSFLSASSGLNLPNIFSKFKMWLTWVTHLHTPQWEKKSRWIKQNVEVWHLRRQGAIFWLPLPMEVIRIIPSILDTRKLPVYVWTACVWVQRLQWTVKHPFSICSIALFWVKIEPIIDPRGICKHFLRFFIICWTIT